MARWSARIGRLSVLVGVVLGCSPTAPPVQGPGFSLVSTQPGDGARGVPRHADITLLLSHAIDEASLAGEGRPAVRLGSGDTAPLIPGTWSVGRGAANNEARFTATPGLVGFGMRVSVTVPAALARSNDGRTLGLAVSFAFETERLPPLRLAASRPLDGGLLARVPSLAVTFSEPPDCASFGVGGPPVVRFLENRDPHPTWVEDGEPRPVQGRWACATPPNTPPFTTEGACRPDGVVGGIDYCTVRFVPVGEEFPGAFDALRLAPSSRVELVLPGDDATPDPSAPGTSRPVRSRRAALAAEGAGGTLAATSRLSFRVEAPPDLHLVQGAPASGRGSLEPDEGLRLTFSEPPSCASLSAVTVEETFDPAVATALGAPGRAVAGRWSCEGLSGDREAVDCARGRCEVTFSPLWPDTPGGWRRASSVRVTIPGGDAPAPVHSQRATSEGGRLTDTVVVTLEVTPPPPIVLREALPANGAADLPAYPFFEWSLSEPPDCDAFLDALRIESRLDPSFGGDVLEPLVRWTCPRAPRVPGGDDARCGGTPDYCRVSLAVLDAQPPSTRINLTLAGGPGDGTVPKARSARATSQAGWLVDDWSTRVQVAPPPAFSAWVTQPADGATSVPVLAEVEVAFSSPVRCESLDAGVSILEGAREVEGYWRCSPSPAGIAATCENSPDSCVARFIPTRPFTRGARVTIDAATGPTSGLRSHLATTSGGWLATPLASSFEVIRPRAPRVVGSSPAPGARLGTRDAPVTLEIDPGDGELDCAAIVPCLSDAAVAANTCTVSMHAEFASGIRRLLIPEFSCPAGASRLRLSADLASVPWGARVEVVVPAGGPAALASREGGLRVPVESTWSAVYLLPVAPAFQPTSIEPWPGAREVSPSRPVTVRFPEAVDCTSVRPGITVQVREVPAVPYGAALGGLARDLPVQATCTGGRVDLVAPGGYSAGARIDVRLLPDSGGNGIRSDAPPALALQLEGELAWSFEVAAPTPPVLVAVSPPPGSPLLGLATLRLTFSRAMRCAAMQQSLRLREEGGVGELLPMEIRCGDESTQSAGTDGPVVTATLLASPAAQQQYQLEVAAGLPATDAIVTSAGPAGLLASTSLLRFVGGASGSLRLTSLSPTGAGTTSPFQPVVLVFDRPIAAGSLIPCGPGGLPADCNTWIAPTTTPLRELTRTLAVRSWSADGRSATLVAADAPAGDWGTRQTLTFTLEGGLRGPAGVDGTRLGSTATTTFVTGDPSMVVGTTPEAGTMAVAVSGEACVRLAFGLATGAQPSFRVDATGDGGLVHLADATVPARVGDADGLSRNLLCTDLTERRWTGHAGRSRLPPSSTITVELPAGIALEDARTTPLQRWTFQTVAPLPAPAVAWVRSNQRRPLSQGPVPAQAILEATWNRGTVPSNLPADAFRVTTAAGDVVPITVQPLARLPTGGFELRPVSRWPTYDNAGTLTLHLAAGDAGPRGTDGATLDLPATAAFVTGTTSSITPLAPGGLLPRNGLLQLVVEGRALDRLTLDGVQLRVDGQAWPTLPLFTAAQPRVLTLAPLTALPLRERGRVELAVTTLADDLGNLVRVTTPGPLGIAAVAQVPATPLDCDVAEDCPVEPALDGTRSIRLPNGDTRWTVRWPLGANEQVPGLQGLILGPATSPVSWLLDDTSSRCASGEARLTGVARPVVDPGGAQLRLTFEPAPGGLIGGCRYVGVLEQARLANIVGELPVTRGCGDDVAPFGTNPLMATGCPGAGRTPGLAIVAESTAPTLTVAGVTDRRGRLLRWTAGGTWPGTGTLRIDADEPLLEGSITAQSVVPSGAQLSADGRSLLVPWTGRRAGEVVALVVDGVTDPSRNAAARLAHTLTIENTPATLLSANVITDARGPTGALLLEFSEPLERFPRATPGDRNGAAPVVVWVGTASQPVAGALRESPNGPHQLVWLPRNPIPSGALVGVDVGDATGAQLADDAGNGVATGSQSATWP